MQIVTKLLTILSLESKCPYGRQYSFWLASDMIYFVVYNDLFNEWVYYIFFIIIRLMFVKVIDISDYSRSAQKAKPSRVLKA